MKRLFLLSAIAIIAICSSSCGSSQSGAPAKPEPPKRHGWDYSPLYGDVESVVMTEYKLEQKFGEIVRGDIESRNKYYFNEAGDVIEEASYDLDGSLRYKTIYKYDSSRNMIEMVSYDSCGSLDDKYTYKYDASGNMIEQLAYNSNGLLFRKMVNKYDSSGNHIEEAHYGSDGSLGNKWVMKYDDLGSRIESTRYSGEALIPHSQMVFEITYRK